MRGERASRVRGERAGRGERRKGLAGVGGEGAGRGLKLMQGG